MKKQVSIMRRKTPPKHLDPLVPLVPTSEFSDANGLSSSGSVSPNNAIIDPKEAILFSWMNAIAPKGVHVLMHTSAHHYNPYARNTGCLKTTVAVSESNAENPETFFQQVPVTHRRHGGPLSPNYRDAFCFKVPSSPTAPKK